MRKYKVGDRVKLKKREDCFEAGGMNPRPWGEIVTISSLENNSATRFGIDNCPFWLLYDWIDDSEDLPIGTFKLSDGTDMEGCKVGSYIHLDKPMKVQVRDSNFDDWRVRYLLGYDGGYKTITKSGNSCWYTYCQLIPKEEATEMTIAEIEKKYNIKNLKIKGEK